MKYETRCFKIKLKPDSVEKARAWAETINERKGEALATVRDEGVFLESVFLDQTAEGDFLVSVMKAKSFEKANKMVRNSLHEIDKLHQKFKEETWETHRELELLIDLENF